VFIPMADTFSQKNPKLVLIDGAQGGQDIVIINNPNATYWTVINQRLTSAGLTYKQVQVVWFKQAQAQPNDTAFASYPDSLKIKFKTALQIAKNKFPNTKLAYLSSRIYAGYATSTLNPEPYAWYSGWSVKRLIEDQINGDTSLTYSGVNARVPWLAWGPYLWADGTTPRSDGLIWVCPTDYNTDGTHPSDNGRLKVAHLLLRFFSTDSTSTPWFLNQASTGIENTAGNNLNTIFPNPFHTAATLHLSLSTVNCQLSIYNVLGEVVKSQIITDGTTVIDRDGMSDGIYFIRVTGDENEWCGKMVVN